MSRLVVKAHSPLRARIMGALLGGLSILAGWALYEYGHFQAGFDFASAKKEQQRLDAAAVELERMNKALREQNAVLERTSQIEQEAYKQLETTVATLQDEILELKEELAFYRGIVSPRTAEAGLTIQRMEISPLGPLGFHYKLVLTQVLKNDKVAQGKATLAFHGLEKGAAKVLSLADVAGAKTRELNFRFKYFQNLEGDIVLPEGFKPLKVSVEVSPRGGNQAKLEKVFDWPLEES